jgi:hypothetical protein
MGSPDRELPPDFDALPSQANPTDPLIRHPATAPTAAGSAPASARKTIGR